MPTVIALKHLRNCAVVMVSGYHTRRVTLQLWYGHTFSDVYLCVCLSVCRVWTLNLHLETAPWYVDRSSECLGQVDMSRSLVKVIVTWHVKVQLRVDERRGQSLSWGTVRLTWQSLSWGTVSGISFVVCWHQLEWFRANVCTLTNMSVSMSVGTGLLRDKVT